MSSTRSMFDVVAAATTPALALGYDAFQRGWTTVLDGFNHPTTVLLLLCAIGVGFTTITVVTAIRHIVCTRTALRSLVEPHLEGEVPPSLADSARRAGFDDDRALQLIDDPDPHAFTYGWVRPRVAVSTGMIQLMDERELDAVLLHEAAHVRRRDPLRMLAARIVTSAFAWVPGTAGAAAAYLCHMEIAADDHAVRAMRSSRPLASALHRMLQHGAHTTAAFAVGLSPTDIRIDRLAGVPTPLSALVEPPSLRHLLVFGFGIALALAFVLASAHGISACLPGAAELAC